MIMRQPFFLSTLCAGLFSISSSMLGAFSMETSEQLWEAARKGDNKVVEALLAQGADVNARSDFGASALWFAAYKGQAATVALLLEHKANPNTLDGVWGMTPMQLAAEAEKPEAAVKMIKCLLAAGADADAGLMEALSGGRAEIIRAILDSAKLKPETLGAALFLTPAKQAETAKLLKAAGAKPLPASSAAALNKLKGYEGAYETHNGMKLTIALREGQLTASSAYGDSYVLKASDTDKLPAIGCPYVSFAFDRDKSGKVIRATRRRGTVELPFERSASGNGVASAPLKPAAEDESVAVSAPRPWPSFRGPGAAGVADGQHPPTSWNVKNGTNIRWKADVPGLAHASPIVWGDRLFLTTALSSDPKTEFKGGLYGAGTSASDTSKHSWRIYCFAAQDGRLLWERTAHEGVPKFKRHIKSSHNNQTPATDGKHVVAFFASEGLYCFDFEGKLLWRQDLGAINVGAFNDPALEWGAASSPIIYKDMVIVQCDRQKESFIAAYAIETGKRVWLTPRDERPSWSTPTVIEGSARDELVACGARFTRAYNPMTGKELWRLGPHSEIPVPAAFAAQGLVFIADGYHPIQPIYAVVPGGSGDISPASGSSANLAWSTKRGGPYMPTPIVCGRHLYTCSNNGMLTCYDARTGQQVYKNRLGGSNGFSASPVAADGRIYLAGAEGDIRVVKAGAEFQLLADNKMGEPCMATPAISNGMIFVRTQHCLYGIGRAQSSRANRAAGGD
jgi:outer membrane protein assembly factor BamB